MLDRIPRRMACQASLAPFFLAFACAACDREPSAAELLAAHPPPPPTASPAPALDATEPGSPAAAAADPPPPAGDLKGDVDAFTTLDACIKSHSHLDPLIGDAIDAIGYDTLIHDSCTVLDAAKAQDARRCNAIDVSALRDRCVATVSELAGKPDSCPWQNPDRRILGREPVCVAVASRDPRLCDGAAEPVDRATCAAIAGHAAGACAKLARGSDRLRCERGADRWRTAIAGAAAASAPAPAGAVHFETLAGGPAVDIDFARELSRGLVLQEQRAGTFLAFGPPRGEFPDRLAVPADALDEVALELTVAPPDPSTNEVRTVRIERLDVVFRGVLYSLLATPRIAATASAPTGLTTLAVKVTSFERTRGGRVELSLEGTFNEAPHPSKGRLRIATFVRDVVRPADVYSLSSDFAPQRSDARRAVALDAGSAQP